MENQHLTRDERNVQAISTIEGVFGSAFIDLAIVLGLAGIAMASAYLPGAGPWLVRLSLAIVLFMFLPGYAFVAALYPRKDDVSGIVRMTLSGGLSLVISPLIGFVLNYTAWGVSRIPMAVGATVFVLAFLGIAAIRRALVPARERFCFDFAGLLKAASGHLLPVGRQGAERRAAIALLASLALVIATLAIVVALPVQHERYTELYLYGSDGMIADYPLQFNLGETRQVIVGISNHEGSTMAYNLSVTVDGISSKRRQIHFDRIILADNETLEMPVNLTMDRAGENLNLQFLLYLDENPEMPYRACNLWVDVKAPSDAPLPANGTALP